MRAVADERDVVGHALEVAGDVRREEDRLPFVLERRRQLVEQFAPEIEVEAGGRLVHDEQVGVVRERDRQRELRLGAVRERLEALAERQAEPAGQARKRASLQRG